MVAVTTGGVYPVYRRREEAGCQAQDYRRTGRYSSCSRRLKTSSSAPGSGEGKWIMGARRPAASRDAKSPNACAFSRIPKEYGSPGIGRASFGSGTTITNTPVGGPPLLK